MKKVDQSKGSNIANPSTSFSVNQGFLKNTFLIISLSVLVSCGGSNSNSGETVSPDVADTSASDLKAAASRNFGSSINSNFENAGGAVSSASDTLADSPLGQSSGNSESVNTQSEAITNSSRGLFDSMLALNDDGDRTTREENKLTIDPDPDEVCAEEALGMEPDQMDNERCMALVEDMEVRIIATSETAGTVHYLFQGQQLASIGYAENAESIEVNLNGLKKLADAENSLNPELAGETELPEIFEGVLKMSASVSNQEEGLEAGRLSFEITQPLKIVDSSSGTEVSVGAGKLLSLAMDEAAGEGSLDIEVGAVQGNLVDEDQSTTNIDLKGLTASITGSTSDGQLKVSNLGIGKGPLVVALDTEKVLDLSLETFGFSVGAEDGQITIDGELNLSMFLNNAVGENVPNVSTMGRLLQLTAPAGTTLITQENGSTLLSQGGPLGYSLTAPDETGNSTTSSLTVNAGQCVSEDESGPVIVLCE